MSIKTDLQTFYDYEAHKYYQTRKKYRKEGERIIKLLTPLFQEAHQKKKTLNILEIGCGSGRFASLLAQHFATNYRYVGVDISQGLLAYAKKECPKGKFICEEMTEFVVRQKQEKFDIIIGTSSFQHIPSARERLFLMKHFYRLLNYDGLLVFTNWSLSQRFLKRYRKEVFGAFVKYVFRGGRGSPRDIFVPRTNKEKTFTRFYHLFSLKELKKLVISSGLTLEQLTYLDEKGTTTGNWKHARSSFLVAKKTPLVRE